MAAEAEAGGGVHQWTVQATVGAGEMEGLPVRLCPRW